MGPHLTLVVNRAHNLKIMPPRKVIYKLEIILKPVAPTGHQNCAGQFQEWVRIEHMKYRSLGDTVPELHSSCTEQ